MRYIIFILALLVLGSVTGVDAHHKDGHDKGGKPGGSGVTIAIVEAPPFIFGQQINLNVVGNDGGWIRNECRQSGSLVYAQFNRVQSGGSSGPFTLGPTPSWSEGGASCTAFAFTKFLERIKKSDTFYEVIPIP